MSSVLTIAVILALLGAALIAGVFFAFSSFVMTALAKRPSSEGIAAMQSINVVVLNPSFLGAFMGTALLSAVVIVLSVMAWGTASPWSVAGASVYIVGTFLVTGLGNVPLNNELAAVDASQSGAVPVWERYLARWTRLNTIRTVAAIASVFLFTVGLMQDGGA